jgi:glycosyltransferase involved in cell wall biosynthesis
MIPHGLDGASITPGDVPKERRVLTCSLLTEGYIPYKGLDTFLRAAWLLPGVPFVHVGPVEERTAYERLVRIAPPNVAFRGFLEDAELLGEMRRCAVYAQLSAHEGFGVALAEAMLAGATPVTTRAGAIPEVAGPLAEYVPYGDPTAAAAAIERALGHPRGEEARRRILTEFPLERRRQGILRVVGDLIGDHITKP